MRNGHHMLVQPLQYLLFMTVTSKNCGDKKNPKLNSSRKKKDLKLLPGTVIHASSQ